MRSGTADLYPRPAEVKIWNVTSCAVCTREQEAYFAVGELMETPRGLNDDGSLAGILGSVLWLG